MLRMSKHKWSLDDGTCSEAFSWPVARLGHDEFGTWVGARQGNAVRRPGGRRAEAQPHDAVWLVDERAWWVPAFWFTDTTDLTIDVCTPPTLARGVWTFVDLELDLFRRADGQAGIVDEDEFDLLVESGHLNDHQVRGAREAARWLLPRVAEGVEPFGEAARRWLRALRA